MNDDECANSPRGPSQKLMRDLKRKNYKNILPVVFHLHNLVDSVL